MISHESRSGIHSSGNGFSYKTKQFVSSVLVTQVYYWKWLVVYLCYCHHITVLTVFQKEKPVAILLEGLTKIFVFKSKGSRGRDLSSPMPLWIHPWFWQRINVNYEKSKPFYSSYSTSYNYLLFQAFVLLYFIFNFVTHHFNLFTERWKQIMFSQTWYTS